MNEWVLSLCMGAAVGWGGKVIHNAWVTWRSKVEEKLLSVGDKFPEWMHNKWDSICHEAIAAMDCFFLDEKKIRNFIRFVYTLKDPVKQKALFDEINSNAIEQWIENASPTMKEAIAEFKQAEAEKIIESKAFVALPKEFVTNKNITETVRATVVSHNSSAPELPKVPIGIGRTVEMQDLIEQLREKVNKPVDKQV